MKIKELFQNEKTILSFEIFPPKDPQALSRVYDTIDTLSELSPDYISVTFGAGGSSSNSLTCDLAGYIKSKYGIEPMAHFTSIGSSNEDITTFIDSLKEKDIHNVLALRGDQREGVVQKNDYPYAADITKRIRNIDSEIGIAGACYPEGHPESGGLINDILHLKNKVDAGAEFLVSQLFFDNQYFYDFLDRTKLAGINVPIAAGIMPVINKSQIERIVSMCGATLPPKFKKMLDRYENNPEALCDAGIAYAVDQIADLAANNVDGIHIFTMNNPYVTKKICDAVATLLKV